MPISIMHLTSLKNAINIARSGNFVPTYRNELAHDSGLNCFEDGLFYHENQITSAEATMYFEWFGAVVVSRPAARPPFEPNILLRQTPHRSMVTYGTTEGLILRSIRASRENWLSNFDKYPWYINSENQKFHWKRRQVIRLKKEISMIIRRHEFIKVG